LDEYQKYFEQDKALERRFQKVMIDEPSPAESIAIMRGLKEKYENHHKVHIEDDALIASVNLSHRYINNRYLPDKAIDLVDEAAAKLRLEMNSVPEPIDVLNSKIRELEIEKEAVKREGTTLKSEKINSDLKAAEAERAELMKRWEAEKDTLKELQDARQSVEADENEARIAERQGNYGRVAELRYGKIAQARKRIAELEAKQASVKNPIMSESVTAEDIAEVVARWTGIPVNRMLESEKTKLLRMEEELHKRVVGQDKAITAVSDAVRRNRAGLSNEHRPIGSFLFLGPTGVGKTELAKALAEFLFNDESMMTRIDMSEYQESHTVSRLIGAPPGYIGYDEGGQLTEAVRNKPYSVILLDEIEKAHADVFNLLLQVLDDGRLTDNKGRTVNFKNTIFIMTSNLKEEELRLRMRPEFLNRIDEIVVFDVLTPENIREIVHIQMNLLKAKLEDENVRLEYTKAFEDAMVRDGYDPAFGARPVKRIIQRELVNMLAREILEGKVRKDSAIVVDYADGKTLLRNK
jgi:ATP-dependent Clp protease ATP-binding subunit ClpB